MTKRQEYIDVMRGIAILLVVFQHSIGKLDCPMSKFVLSFHMPLFFFISGMCFAFWGGYKSFIIKKIKTILVPQLTLGVISVLTKVLVDVCVIRNTLFREVDYISGFLIWFLIVLFLMEIVMAGILPKIKREMLWLPALVFLLAFIVVEYNEIVYLQQLLCALVFGILGYIMRPVLDRLSEHKDVFGGTGIILLSLVAFLSYFNEPAGMYINQYGNKLLFFVIAMFGIMAVFELSRCLKDVGFLLWSGRNSIIIYVTHFSLLYVLRIVICQFNTITVFHHSPSYIVLFIAVIMVEIPIIYFSNKYLPFLFGRVKTKRELINGDGNLK